MSRRLGRWYALKPRFSHILAGGPREGRRIHIQSRRIASGSIAAAGRSHTHTTHTQGKEQREKGQIQTKGLALQGVSGLNPFRCESSCLNGPRLTNHRNRPWVGIFFFLLPNYPQEPLGKGWIGGPCGYRDWCKNCTWDVIGDRGKARHCEKNIYGLLRYINDSRCGWLPWSWRDTLLIFPLALCTLAPTQSSHCNTPLQVLCLPYGGLMHFCF